MRLLAGLIVAIALVALAQKAIKRFPAIFYVLALAADVLLVAGSVVHLPPWFREYFMFLFQSNTLAMGLFTLVMFAGAFDEGTAIRRILLGLRAELSIIASLLSIGHVVMYGQSYLGQLLAVGKAMPALRLSAILIALVLVVLLVPLAVTSVKRLRAKMSQRAWKRLQRLAYPFYLLIFVHIMFYLVAPAQAGSSSATVSVAVYAGLGVVYVLARLRLHLKARPPKPRLEQADQCADS
jgi:DMSO/TMAO reductase YedYZ heme-binding membrane subunit